MKIRIIGVPSTWGAPGPGAQRTPARLREAGLGAWLADAGHQVEDRGDVPVAPQADDDFPGAAQVQRVAEMAVEVRRATGDALRDGCLALLVGGECSLAIGAVAALTAERGAPTIAWLDAHGDINTPATSASGLATGMPLAVVLGHGHGELTAVGADTRRTAMGDDAHRPAREEEARGPAREDDRPRPAMRDDPSRPATEKEPPERAGASTYLVGGRDLDAGEVTNIGSFGVRHIDTTAARAAGPEHVAMQVLSVPEIAVIPPEARAQLAAADPRAAEALAAPPGPPVYLHFDVDALDPEYAPGVYYPVPGGFDPAEVATLAGYLCASGRVGVLTIASANLDRDADGRTVAAIRDVVTSIADALALV